MFVYHGSSSGLSATPNWSAESDQARAGQPELPKGKMKTDEYFGDVEVYLDSFVAPVSIARATPEAMDLEIEVGYQGCAEGGLC